MIFGTDTYRAGALERLGESEILMRSGRYAGSLYLIGLAVEGMLRSLVWLKEREFDERHDLRRIASRIEDLGLLSRPKGKAHDEDFVVIVQAFARNWRNNFRFADMAKIEREISGDGVAKPKRGKMLRSLCEAQFERGSTIIKRCEVLWENHRKH